MVPRNRTKQGTDWTRGLGEEASGAEKDQSEEHPAPFGNPPGLRGLSRSHFDRESRMNPFAAVYAASALEGDHDTTREHVLVLAEVTDIAATLARVEVRGAVTQVVEGIA